MDIAVAIVGQSIGRSTFKELNYRRNRRICITLINCCIRQFG